MLERHVSGQRVISLRNEIHCLTREVIQAYNNNLEVFDNEPVEENRMPSLTPERGISFVDLLLRSRTQDRRIREVLQNRLRTEGLERALRQGINTRRSRVENPLAYVERLLNEAERVLEAEEYERRYDQEVVRIVRRRIEESRADLERRRRSERRR